MKTTASLLLLTQTISSQQMVLSVLGNYHCSLSESERRTLTKSVISLAANTVENLDGLTIILQSLDTPAANEVERLLCAMANAVELATRSWIPGEREKLMLQLWKPDRRRISPDTSAKNTVVNLDRGEPPRNLPACHSDRDSDWE